MFIGFGLNDPGYKIMVKNLHEVHKGDIKPSYALIKNSGKDIGSYMSEESTLIAAIIV